MDHPCIKRSGALLRFNAPLVRQADCGSLSQPEHRGAGQLHLRVLLIPASSPSVACAILGA